jgi:hypothetical protein
LNEYILIICIDSTLHSDYSTRRRLRLLSKYKRALLSHRNVLHSVSGPSVVLKATFQSNGCVVGSDREKDAIKRLQTELDGVKTDAVEKSGRIKSLLDKVKELGDSCDGVSGENRDLEIEIKALGEKWRIKENIMATKAIDIRTELSKEKRLREKADSRLRAVKAKLDAQTVEFRSLLEENASLKCDRMPDSAIDIGHLAQVRQHMQANIDLSQRLETELKTRERLIQEAIKSKIEQFEAQISELKKEAVQSRSMVLERTSDVELKAALEVRSGIINSQAAIIKKLKADLGKANVEEMASKRKNRGDDGDIRSPKKPKDTVDGLVFVSSSHPHGDDDDDGDCDWIGLLSPIVVRRSSKKKIVENWDIQRKLIYKDLTAGQFATMITTYYMLCSSKGKELLTRENGNTTLSHVYNLLKITDFKPLDTTFIPESPTGFYEISILQYGQERTRPWHYIPVLKQSRGHNMILANLIIPENKEAIVDPYVAKVKEIYKKKYDFEDAPVVGDRISIVYIVNASIPMAYHGTITKINDEDGKNGEWSESTVTISFDTEGEDDDVVVLQNSNCRDKMWLINHTIIWLSEGCNSHHLRRYEFVWGPLMYNTNEEKGVITKQIHGRRVTLRMLLFDKLGERYKIRDSVADILDGTLCSTTSRDAVTCSICKKNNASWSNKKNETAYNFCLVCKKVFQPFYDLDPKADDWLERYIHASHQLV